MIVCLFLDTDEREIFPGAARTCIREVCEAAEAEARDLLPMLPERIEVATSTGRFVIPETGELGSAVTETRVAWTVDPDRDGGIEAVARQHLRCTLFHEFHHLARGWVGSGTAHRERFIDGVICEGLATAFERDAAGRTAPWAEYPPEAEAWVDELAALSTSAPYNDWMFQHPDGRRWIGYRAGTLIADRAMRASGQSAAELVLTPGPDVLRMAGFGG